MPHSSVYFYQEIEDHQLKNDNQKNKKVLHWGHFVENFSITGHKKQVLYFPLNRLNPYDLYVAVVFVFHQLFSFWFSSPIIRGNSDKQPCYIEYGEGFSWRRVTCQQLLAIFYTQCVKIIVETRRNFPLHARFTSLPRHSTLRKYYNIPWPMYCT